MKIKFDDDFYFNFIGKDSPVLPKHPSIDLLTFHLGRCNHLKGLISNSHKENLSLSKLYEEQGKKEAAVAYGKFADRDSKKILSLDKLISNLDGALKLLKQKI